MSLFTQKLAQQQDRQPADNVDDAVVNGRRPRGSKTLMKLIKQSVSYNQHESELKPFSLNEIVGLRNKRSSGKIRQHCIFGEVAQLPGEEMQSFQQIGR